MWRAEAGVPRVGHDITLFHRKLRRIDDEIDGIRSPAVLFFAGNSINCLIERLQMCIRGDISIVMSDEQHLPVTVWGNADSIDEAVPRGKNLVACVAVCTDIDAAVKMR